MQVIDQLRAAAERRLAAADRHGARVLLEEALAGAPTDRAVLHRLAALVLADQPDLAAHLAQRILALAPQDTEALGLLGQAFAGLGERDAALAALSDVVARQPESGPAWCNLALARLRAGDPAGAAEAAQAAIARAPGLAEAHANLGHARTALGQPEAALEAFAGALALRAEDVDALAGIASACTVLGRSSGAVAALRRALAAAPDRAASWNDLGIALRALGAHAAATGASRQAVALAPADPGFISSLLMGVQYDPGVGPVAAAAEAAEWGRSLLAALPPLPPLPRPTRRRLRVGYVSADLRQHPVGWMGGGAIAAHDPERIETILYATAPGRDPLSDRLAATARWCSVSGMGDASLAARIRADEVDVLVDLSGHTAGGRLGVFARRPAPVQVTWLGYFATTGLPVFDAVLLDEAHVLPDTQAQFVEPIRCLPGGRFGYFPPDDAPDPAPPPSAAGGGVTFGCFNNTAKLNDAVIELWSALLRRVPDSRLVLKWRSLADPFLCEGLRAAFAAHGIGAERLEFAGISPHRALLEAYGGIDVALDPFPFTGALTTCEALWMGVPVVTLPGRSVVSRQGLAILRAIGREAWVARDAAQYLDLAAGLAGDLAGRTHWRGALRPAMRAAPLCDPVRLARALEEAYRALCA